MNMNQKRANPKRLAELARTLLDLREWARIEAAICVCESERPLRKIWSAVADWADGQALRYKLNLAAVQSEREGAREPKATPDANGDARLQTRVSAGGAVKPERL